MGMDNQVVLTSFVYEMDAQVLVLELQASGIDAMVRKDDCGGARPAITNERGIEVLVAKDDLTRAQEILRVINAEKANAAPVDQQPRRKGVLPGVFFGGVLVGAFLVWGYAWLEERDADYSGVVQEDFSGDGMNDAQFEYDKDGNTMRSVFDNNNDGEWDVWFSFKDNITTTSRHDLDFNGKLDALMVYETGNISSITFTPNENDAFGRKQFYEYGVFKFEEVDTTGDGKYDTRIQYDPFQKIISEESI
ncbi:hypothetical protein P4B35_17345 [Pontiellaceae bacterium B12227]|nr:hypothetical protein [Pontiellaceae bacterium B12227]